MWNHKKTSSQKQRFKATRERKNPIKKWMPAEEAALINFLKENVDFEKPTAQVFYKRFLQSSAVIADWKIVRSKVRNMRTTYSKTREWINTVGKVMADDETVETTTHNMCRFYYDFEEIFGSNIFSTSSNLDSFQTTIVNLGTLSDQTCDEPCIAMVKTEKEEIENVDVNMTSHDRSFSGSQTLSSHAEIQPFEDIPDNIPTTNCSEAYFGTAMSEMAQTQAEILKLKKEKMQFDTMFKEKIMQLLERQIAIQENKLELKKTELSSQEHLKILELEMKERIAMKELELKYKSKN
ncbi:uncharacterized protein LOC119675024 [Teleopsis dalmanni]|uniref:uncharacterized protein LOC119675024 n=1 Tax=Teleopsis dalmanni TaxID=139649 RepID=UPI0018CE3FB5|nr:uncharacterized protein LOC119675024 [Teleopsis dalmanni]